MRKRIVRIAVAMGIVGTAIFGLTACEDGCPEGKSSHVTGYIPIQSGKTMVMSPIIQCL